MLMNGKEKKKKKNGKNNGEKIITRMMVHDVSCRINYRYKLQMNFKWISVKRLHC